MATIGSSPLASRDRWTCDELLLHQARALAEQRAFALARSPFYREFHRGLETSPLDALPVLTKATMMERFDELVTDRNVRLGDVEAHLASAGPTDLFRGRYRVAATGGTTGRRGVFLADRSEWTSVLASYARANDWAGVPAGLLHRAIPRTALGKAPLVRALHRERVAASLPPRPPLSQLST